MTFPFIGSSGSYHKIFVNFLKISKSSVNHIFVITGNSNLFNDPEVEVINLRYIFRENLITKLFFYFLMQFKYVHYILRYHKKFDMFFVLAGHELLLPILILRIMGKKPVLTAFAPKSKYSEHKKGFFNRCYTFLICTLESLNLKLAYKIILESPSVSSFMGLEEYNDKLEYGALYIDDNKFEKKAQVSQRPDLVGFIGRLSEEKGVINFVKAVNIMKGCNFNFLIRGEGPLKHDLSDFIKENDLENIQIGGWVPYDQIPLHLNKLKLLVMPSYTEGLPNLMLEAMACGTPVLATPVGGIPDFIEDGVTGFLMENNSPECIAQNIKRVFKHKKMGDLSENAHKKVKSEFSDRNVTLKWSKLFNKL